MIPSPTSGSPISAPSAATRRSQASASSSPPPSAAPFIAAMNDLRRPLDPEERVPHSRVERVDLLRRHPGALLQVRAGAERPVARAGEDHRPQGPVARRGANAAPQLAEQRHREGVPARLALDRPDLDRALPLGRQLHQASVRASSACSVFPGSRRPTSRCASAPAAMSLSKSMPVSYPIPCEHVDEILGREVPGRPRRVRTAAEPADGGVEGGDPGVEPDEDVRERGSVRVVHVEREPRRRAPSAGSARGRGGCRPGSRRRWCRRARPDRTRARRAAPRPQRTAPARCAPRTGSRRPSTRTRARAAPPPRAAGTSASSSRSVSSTVRFRFLRLWVSDAERKTAASTSDAAPGQRARASRRAARAPSRSARGPRTRPRRGAAARGDDASASASCGIQRGDTKLVASMRADPRRRRGRG